MQGVLGVSQDRVPPIRLFHYFKVCAVFPDVTNELLCRCFYGNFAVNDTLNGRGPAHGFVQQLCVQSVRVLPTMDYDVPVACGEAKVETKLEGETGFLIMQLTRG